MKSSRSALTATFKKERYFIEYLFFGLAGIAAGFLMTLVLTSDLGARAVPSLIPDGTDKCNLGLYGDTCSETQSNVRGPQDILKTWIFSEAVPWWISFFIVLSGGVAVIMVMVGGIFIVVAGENSDRRSKGIQTIIWALVGLLITTFAFVAVSIIANIPLPGSTGPDL